VKSVAVTVEVEAERDHAQIPDRPPVARLHLDGLVLVVDVGGRLDSIRGVGREVVQTVTVVALLGRNGRLRVLGEEVVLFGAILPEAFGPLVDVGRVTHTSPCTASRFTPAPSCGGFEQSLDGVDPRIHVRVRIKHRYILETSL